MEDSNIELQLVIEIPGIQLIEIQNSKQTLISTGLLQIFEISAYNLYMLKLDDFKYTLSPEIPIMTMEKNNINPNVQYFRIYVMPFFDKFYGLKFTELIEEELFDCVDALFASAAQLICTASQEEIESLQIEELSKQLLIHNSILLKYNEESKLEAESKEKLKANQQQYQPKKEKVKMAKKISNAIEKGGQYIRGGLISNAQKVAPYINKGGQYIKLKLNKNKKETIVSPQYVIGAKLANISTKSAATFTKQQVEGMVQVASMIGNEAIKSAENSKTGLQQIKLIIIEGQKVTNLSNYNDIKQIGKTTVLAGLSIYDGLYSALAIIAESLGDVSCQILEHRYGAQVGNVAKESVQIAGNIGSLGRVYKTVIVNAALQQNLQQQNQNDNQQQQQEQNQEKKPQSELSQQKQ